MVVLSVFILRLTAALVVRGAICIHKACDVSLEEKDGLQLLQMKASFREQQAMDSEENSKLTFPNWPHIELGPCNGPHIGSCGGDGGPEPPHEEIDYHDGFNDGWHTGFHDGYHGVPYDDHHENDHNEAHYHDGYHAGYHEGFAHGTANVAAATATTTPGVATTTAAVGTTAVISAPATFTTTAPDPSVTTKASNAAADVAEWLNLINSKRAFHGACPMTWNSVLAADMLSYLKTLTSLHHDDVYHLTPPHGPCGENLAWASDGESPQTAVEGWYNEVHDCAHPISQDGCLEPTPGKMVGHFTALVWKGAREVGCAIYNTYAGCRFMEHDAIGLSGNTPNMHGEYVNNVGELHTTPTGC